MTSSHSESDRSFFDALREPRESELVDSLIRGGFVVALSGVLALLNPALGGVFFAASVFVGLAIGPPWVRRGAFVVLGAAISALDVGLLLDRATDDSGEMAGGLVILAIGLFNLSFGVIPALSRRLVIVGVVDLILLGLCLGLLSQMTIG